MKLFIMYFTKVTVLCWLMLFITQCQTDVEKTTVTEQHTRDLFYDYGRKGELKTYLKKEFDLKLGDPKTDTILFIPLNSCDKCVKNVIESMRKNNFSGLMVFSGNIAYKPLFKEAYEELLEKNFCLVDTNSNLDKYNIDVFSPTLIILSGKKPRFALIDFQNWEKVCKVVSWKL